MTGIASNLAPPFETVLIQIKHHLHHFPRGLLRLLVILFEVTLYVTETALHS